jgi:hypothetical protein
VLDKSDEVATTVDKMSRCASPSEPSTKQPFAQFFKNNNALWGPGVDDPGANDDEDDSTLAGAKSHKVTRLFNSLVDITTDEPRTTRAEQGLQFCVLNLPEWFLICARYNRIIH